MKQRLKKTNYTKGFTLIEMMIAIGIFAVVVTITSGTFILSLKGQRKSVTAQNVADNARYAMEIMAKEIRMGSDFIEGAGYIQFTSNMPNRAGKTVRFSFDSDASQILFDDDTADTVLEEPITSANSGVTMLKFHVTGTETGNQPRITIVLHIASNNTSPDVASFMILQTTISPRSL